tara:strand:- start:2042 stop:2254 length:213 start_codon:yes stop_codon:yes gene_type:complete
VTRRIDARGMRCPWPAIQLARALRDGVEQIEILADDPAAERELAEVARASGAGFERSTATSFVIRRTARV